MCGGSVEKLVELLTRGFKDRPSTDFSYADKMIEQNFMPTVVANQLPIIFTPSRAPPPNPYG